MRGKCYTNLAKETLTYGLCKVKNSKKSDLTMECSGWVGPGLNRIFLGKSSQKSLIPALLFLSCIPLLKVVSYYDFSVLSMSLMVIQFFFFYRGGWGRLYPVFLGNF